MFFFFSFDETYPSVSDVLSRVGDGRIGSIISALEQYYNTDIKNISPEHKLYFLTTSLGLSVSDFDRMIAKNSPVLRTVKGHAFEVAFEYFCKKYGYELKDIGGDTDIDAEVNGHKLQLKTPYVNGTTESSVSYKTHKTHGAKSEEESMDYYHHIDDFADFFVGLISYVPFKVFIVPKNELPRHPKSKKYILSPFSLSMETSSKYHRRINDFSSIGMRIPAEPFTDLSVKEKELLPLTANEIGLNSEVIIDCILRKSNFRIWDMSIRGFAREVALSKYLGEKKISHSNKPTEYRESRGDKADLVLLHDKRNKQEVSFVQVKGLSLNNCRINGENLIIATETQLTRGRVNDHPTQSRLYLKTDFDYLLLAIDPSIMYKINSSTDWGFYLIPTSLLSGHKTLTRRLASLQKFRWDELKKFSLSSQIESSL